LVVGSGVEPDIENRENDIQDDQAYAIDEDPYEAQCSDAHEGVGIEIRKAATDEDEDEIGQWEDQPDADLLKTDREGAFVEVPEQNDGDGDDGVQ